MTTISLLPRLALAMLFPLCLVSLRAADEPAKPAEAAPTAVTAAPTPLVVESPEVVELKARLAETEGKLATALRSYALVEQEAEKNKQAAVNALETEMTQLRSANNKATLELASLREQLRQTQGQLAAIAEENASLRTKLALRAPYPAAPAKGR